jgi:hypothetical protein
MERGGKAMSTGKSLEHLAEKVRIAYCAERDRWEKERHGNPTGWGRKHHARWDGGQGGDGTRYESIWLKIAQQVVRCRLDATRFVRAQFQIRRADVPLPNALLGENALAIYYAQRQQGCSELVQLFAYQKDRYALAMYEAARSERIASLGQKHLLKVVLTNLMLECSALFRYCIAKREGLQEVVDMFRQEALEQYLGQPDDYDNVWGEWIPHELRRDLDQLSGTKPEPMSAERLIELHQPHQRAIIMD